MPNRLFKKGLLIGTIALFIGMSVYPISGLKNKNFLHISSDSYQDIGDCPINITVHEAYDLLTNSSNGIQIPIDIRGEDNWNESFIDTPWPEHPRWIGHIDDVMEELYGEEVIVYCEGGYRSLIWCYLVLCSANFTGTVYNMNGGIKAWIEAGLPVRNNTPPDAPTVKGKVMIHQPGPYNYKFKATDPENDYLRYFIDWGDGTYEWTDYNESGKEIIVSHYWNDKGTAMVVARANDTYGALGPEGYLEWSKDDNKKKIIRNIVPYKDEDKLQFKHIFPLIKGYFIIRAKIFF
ncbi:hypothetical protein AYK24_07525 [Thermoplasmatales archaeon SG8-52-4]|nr:MAG: hypothetical protein AYK24_07525 [Thermoplasmatales archaeon SG8-52-4]